MGGIIGVLLMISGQTDVLGIQCCLYISYSSAGLPDFVRSHSAAADTEVMKNTEFCFRPLQCLKSESF